MAERIAAVGYDYVGISLDGIGATPRPVPPRRKAPSTRRSRGMRLLPGARHQGRPALHHHRAQRRRACRTCSTSWSEEGIDKFYLSHLVYAGRGNSNRGDDAHHRTTRARRWTSCSSAAGGTSRRAGDKRVRHRQQRCRRRLFPAVGRSARFPERAEHIRAKLEAVGRQRLRRERRQHRQSRQRPPRHDLVALQPRQREASGRSARSGTDISDPIMAGLKAQAAARSRAAAAPAAHFAICGGNTRVRAMQLTGDPWAEDPACYLTDEEIGVAAPADRLERHAVPEEARMQPLAARVALAAAAAAALPLAAPAAPPRRRRPSTPQHCAACHGADRLGGMGPALLPENLGRLKPDAGAAVIAEGRAATQMPGFGDELSAGGDRGARGLRPDAAARDRRPGARPRSRRRASARRCRRALPDRPLFAADPLNLFVVVESRRPSRHHPRRRPLRAAHPLPDPLRAARRAQVLARRPLRLLHVARRLGHALRLWSLQRRGRGPGRDQQPQHRDLGRRPVHRRRQLPAAHAASCSTRRPAAARGDAGRGHFKQQDLARLAPSTRRRRARASSWR